MSVEVLIDANVLVYAHVLQDARKQNRAGTLALAGPGAIRYTEDGPTGATIEGVRYVNPFSGPTLFVVKEEPRTPYGSRSKRRRPPTRSHRQ